MLLFRIGLMMLGVSAVPARAEAVPRVPEPAAQTVVADAAKTAVSAAERERRRCSWAAAVMPTVEAAVAAKGNAQAGLEVLAAYWNVRAQQTLYPLSAPKIAAIIIPSLPDNVWRDAAPGQTAGLRVLCERTRKALAAQPISHTWTKEAVDLLAADSNASLSKAHARLLLVCSGLARERAVKRQSNEVRSILYQHSACRLLNL